MSRFYLNTYQEYKESTLSLTLEEMESVYTQMTKDMAGDEDAIELYQDILEQAVKYVEYRSNWILWDNETKVKNDEIRSNFHNSLILKMNIFARYMKSAGHSTEWRDILGDENSHSHVRKRIGDFACYMVFINALGAR